MKATSLKRLTALEQAAIPNTRPPRRLAEARRFAHDDQLAFWSGDQTVLSRYGLPDDRAPTGSIRALVINVHPASREDWLATIDLDDDDELEAFEQRRINDELRREREAKAEA